MDSCLIPYVLLFHYRVNNLFIIAQPIAMLIFLLYIPTERQRTNLKHIVGSVLFFKYPSV